MCGAGCRKSTRGVGDQTISYFKRPMYSNLNRLRLATIFSDHLDIEMFRDIIAVHNSVYK